MQTICFCKDYDCVSPLITPHLVQDGPKEPKPPVGAYQIFVQEEVLGDV